MNNSVFIKEQFTERGFKAFKLMVEYSYKYPKNFFGNPRINIRHSLLVRDFSLYLQKIVGGNLEIIEVAALFHDLGKISTVEGHEDLIVKLITKHQQTDFRFSEEEFRLLLNVCSEDKQVEKPVEFKILHNSDNLAFLYDAQYQEAFYRFIGTKALLFSKRMNPKLEGLNFKPAMMIGKAMYENARIYWKKRPEEAEERYRPDIEGKTLPSFEERLQ